jgi:fumarate hydratase class II
MAEAPDKRTIATAPCCPPIAVTIAAIVSSSRDLSLLLQNLDNHYSASHPSYKLLLQLRRFHMSDTTEVSTTTKQS